MDYLEGQSKSGIKVGDKVIVTRIVGNYESGWQNSWVSMMDEYVGKVRTVTELSQFGIGLEKLEGRIIGFNFPYFVLRPTVQGGLSFPALS